ncbi:MAG TPA: hypothetical protein VFZ24_02680 [Longimicrobiales bacterium]
MLFWILLLFGVAVAFGLWRRFGPIQWIWLLFGTAIALLIVWFILIMFVIGPEMVRRGPPGS